MDPFAFSPVLLPGALFLILILILVRFLPALHVGLNRSIAEYAAENSLQVENQASLELASIASREIPAFSVFTPEVQHWSDAILDWAKVYDLPPVLVAVVMQIESCGDPDAVSPSGALGLFQVMPFHFGEGEDMLLPETNALRGLDYLKRSYQLAGGRIDLTLAGYNGGLSQINVPHELWPDETQRYVYWGLGIWNDLKAGNPTSRTLSDWLAAGGNRLCRNASLSQTVHQ